MPNDAEITGIIEGLVKGFRDLDGFDAILNRIERAGDLCRGLTRFATEEAVSRNLTKKSIDLKGLADIQRRIIEMATDQGLVYERGLETFDDIGGQASFKQFLSGLFAGPRRLRLVVRWDEIDKSVSSAASGTSADNTGVSQDMLKVLLTSIGVAQGTRLRRSIFFVGLASGSRVISSQPATSRQTGRIGILPHLRPACSD